MSKQKNVENQRQSISLDGLNVASVDNAVSSQAFSVWVRALLQNWRQGTVGCKGRSDVNRTNKKPWKQKGTGRARAGSARSPLWRGGGVVFGPQPRTRILSVPKQARNLVCKALLGNRIELDRLVSLNWQALNGVPSTASAFSALKNVGLNTEKVVLFVTQDDALTQTSFANLPNVRVISFDQANAFDLARGAYWVVLTKDEQAFKDMVSRWN